MDIYACQARTKLPQGIYRKQGGDSPFNPRTDGRPTKRSKAEADIKTPDMAYWVNGKLFPTVGFEVRFTESQDDLVEDVDQWLVGGNTKIKAVVLVKIQEGPTTGSGTNHTRGLKREALEQALAKLTATGELDADDSDDDIPLSSPPEHPEDLERSLHMINCPAYFATPLTVLLETWRYDTRTRSEYRDGPGYPVYPIPDVNPTLSIDMDLLGLDNHQVTMGTSDRKLELDQKLLHKHLEDGLREYAVERKQSIEKYVKAGLEGRLRV